MPASPAQTAASISTTLSTAANAIGSVPAAVVNTAASDLRGLAATLLAKEQSFIHAHPWLFAGIAAGVGFALGFGSQFI